MPVIRTMISQSAPFIPRDSASLYTQTHSRMAMIKKTIGTKQKRPANPATSQPACNIDTKLTVIHLRYSFRMTFLIKFTSATVECEPCSLLESLCHCFDFLSSHFL